MPFAGFKDFNDCVRQQKKQGNDEVSAKRICGFIKKKTEEKVNNMSEVKEYLKGIKGFNPQANKEEMRSFNAEKEQMGEIQYLTSMDNKHFHKWKKEDAYTTVDNGHSHPIDESSMMALQSDGHSHDLLLEDASARLNAANEKTGGSFPLREFNKGLMMEAQRHPTVGIMDVAQMVLDKLKEDVMYYSNKQEAQSPTTIPGDADSEGDLVDDPIA